MEKINFDYDLFKQIIGPLVANNVTDVHIAPMSTPFIRQAKKLQPLRIPMRDQNGQGYMNPVEPMTSEDTEKFAIDLLKDSQSEERAEEIIKEMYHKEVDTTLSIAGVSRFRVHISLQRTSLSLSLRVVPSKVQSFSGFPKEIRNFVQFQNGLIIVSGKTSSGKSTTLATLIEEMNKTQNRKIVTLEDPIEYLHKHNQCMIVQREIGIDTATYKTGLLSALREDPDVIIIGELRDVDSFEIALNAAESGCLVMTTMHSGDAKETLERIISMYPDEKQNQVKSQLANVLKGIVCQQLIPCIDENYGSPLVAAFEIMTSNTPIANAIRKGKFADIPNLIQANKKMNMRLMKDSLQQLRQNGLISEEDWFARNSLINE